MAANKVRDLRRLGRHAPHEKRSGGAGVTAKLTDFGLVKDLGSELNLTDATNILGTPNFMAPEQFDDPTKVDRRCDVYSLAATLYMLLTAELPFRAANYLATMQKKLRGELVRPRELV